MTRAVGGHCRELLALRKEVEDMRSQQDADRLAFAGILSALHEQLDQLRRDLTDEKRLNGPLRGRIGSLEWAS